MLRHIRRGMLFLVAFSLPIQGYAFNVAGFPATPTKLVTVGLIVLAALQFLAPRRASGPRDRKMLWVLAFAISYALSTVASLVQGAPRAWVLNEAVSHLSMLFYYFLLVYVIQQRSDFVVVLWGLVLGAAITPLPALLGFEVGVVASDDDARFQGLSGQTNIMGRDMAIAVPVAVALFIASRGMMPRIAAAGTGVLAAAGLALSLSRAALVSAGSMWGLWVLWTGRKGVLRSLPIALLLGIGVLVFSPESVTSRLQTMIDPAKRAADRSIQGRFEQNTWALRAFASNPFMGVGTANFVSWTRAQPGGFRIGNVIHNGYLTVAAEQGLLGLVPFLAILGLAWFDFGRTRRIAFRERWRNDRELQELGHYALYLQLAFFSTLVGGLAHPNLKAKTMWLLIALSTVALSMARQRVAARSGVEAEAQEPAFEPGYGAGAIGTASARTR